MNCLFDDIEQFIDKRMALFFLFLYGNTVHWSFKAFFAPGLRRFKVLKVLRRFFCYLKLFQGIFYEIIIWPAVSHRNLLNILCLGKNDYFCNLQMLACAAVRINLLYFVVPEPIYDDFMLDRFTILYLTSLMDINLLGHRTVKKTRTT